jgi:hypothetical protein
MSIMVLVRFADALALLLSCQGRGKHWLQILGNEMHEPWTGVLSVMLDTSHRFFLVFLSPFWIGVPRIFFQPIHVRGGWVWALRSMVLFFLHFLTAVPSSPLFLPSMLRTVGHAVLGGCEGSSGG